MEPWYRTDESRQQIGKKEVQTLVYDTLNTTTIHVEKDKKRPALYRCSSGMVFRPTTHDGYTGNRKLRYYRPPDSLPDKANDRLRKAAVESEIHQRCFVHVLRNVEDVAMKKGIGSPETDRTRGIIRSLQIRQECSLHSALADRWKSKVSLPD